MCVQVMQQGIGGGTHGQHEHTVGTTLHEPCLITEIRPAHNAFIHPADKPAAQSTGLPTGTYCCGTWHGICCCATNGRTQPAAWVVWHATFGTSSPAADRATCCGHRPQVFIQLCQPFSPFDTASIQPHALLARFNARQAIGPEIASPLSLQAIGAPSESARPRRSHTTVHT